MSLLIQTIAVMMFFSIYHLLPLVTRKSEKRCPKNDAEWQRQHRNQTQGEKNIHSLISHFCQQQKWKKIQDLNHSDTESDLRIDANGK